VADYFRLKRGENPLRKVVPCGSGTDKVKISKFAPVDNY
jgi:hypothetical protein